MSTRLVKLAITEHPKYQEEAPERFDWDLVINHREKEIAQMVAAEIVTRRGAWLNEGKQGTDPLIPGLQETLRLMAQRCIWKHTQVTVASPAEEASSDGDLRGSQRQGGDVPVSAERAPRVRPDRSGVPVPVAGSAGSRRLGKGAGPRYVGDALDT